MELDFLSVAETLKALSLGGISLAILVVILTEVIKEFAGLEGKAVRAVALGLGFALTAIAYGMAEGLIPASAAPYIEWVFAAVAGGLGGMGLWHLGKRFLSSGPGEQSPEDMALAYRMMAEQAPMESGEFGDAKWVNFLPERKADSSETITAGPIDGLVGG